ncbi:hypothetical protein N7471_010229 [Penicillium samsonianum]|uniref:uncharacterized protein n=1 Tax=Penicillium samsonianum TaxID=1882272 RepID=UPI002546DED8|nr:uncharacterized protein N7471_010229 [Penicillium samsonianum]KAJ6129012.1 hypothetical protein N7471_010229 [Penicillium samsonianum]
MYFATAWAWSWTFWDTTDFKIFKGHLSRTLYQAKEDTHCDDMRRLGATWWRRLSDAYEKGILGYDDEKEPFIRVGWPASGGVWVLHSTEAEAGRMGAGRIQNAYSMEERCKVIKQWGGIF